MNQVWRYFPAGGPMADGLCFLAPHMAKCRSLFLTVVVIGIVSAFAEFAGLGTVLLLLSLLFAPDQALDFGDETAISSLISIFPESLLEPLGFGALTIFFVILRLAMSTAQNIISSIIVARVSHDTRSNSLRANMSASFEQEQDENWSDSYTAIEEHSSAAPDAVDALSNMIQSLTVAAILALLLLLVSPVLALSGFVAFLSLNALATALQKRVEGLAQENAAQTERMNAQLMRILQAKRTLRTMGVIAREVRSFDLRSQQVAHTGLKLDKVSVILEPASHLSGLFAVAAMALTSVWLGIEYSLLLLTVGLLYRMVPYVSAFADSRLTFAECVPVLRCLPVLIEPAPAIISTEIEALSGDIRFEDVTFQYEARASPTLKNLSFRIPIGGVTMINGASGSGKSTIVNHILRLLEPDSGRIFVGRMPLNTLDKDSWYRLLAISGQQIELVSGTLKENLLLGVSDQSDAAITSAMKISGLDQVLDGLPDGLDQKVGERATQLSGGQAQRLSIARAILRRPSLLILDEATSMLDGESQESVLSAIVRKMTGRTLIIIGHHVPASLPLDMIIALDAPDGKLRRPQQLAQHA